MSSLPTFADVQAAARRLEGITLRTPLLENARINALLGGRLFIKAECLQRTGSFKLRGAYNYLSLMSEADRAKGAVGWSSGNHAQGLAEAARLMGMKATIVMPADAPLSKREVQILQMVAYGSTTKEVAHDLGTSPHTVKTHLERIFEKLGANDRAQAVAIAIRRGLVE